MRIAVLADIHAARAPLATALRDARAEGFDAMLILGDLLTYGVEPTETIDLIADAVARDGAILVRGNHDQLYLAGDAATRGYLDGLPDWLRESVAWTAAQIDLHAMLDFDWQENWSAGTIFAAHANPHPFGDWTYLTDQAGAEVAGRVLAGHGHRHGIFAHTHRARRFDTSGAWVHTVGSLGQPRDRDDPRALWAMVTESTGGVRVDPRPVAFDRAAQIDAIRATSMSPATCDRLCGYFV